MIINEDSNQKPQLKTSCRGIAEKYANTSLSNKEKEIMEQAFSKEPLDAKDKIAQDFIKEVNPYRKKPSLGIDLRRLSKYAKENNKDVRDELKLDLREKEPEHDSF